MSATTYQRQYHSFNKDNKITVNGEIVHVVNAAKGLTHGAEVLVKLPEDDEKGPTPEENTGGPFFCEYERDNGELCSREVDNEGDRCWQHPYGDDE